MPRSQTGPEAALLAGAERQITRRVKVANGSGTMIDVSSWVESVTRDRDIDQPVSALKVAFRRDSGTTQSLSPFRTDSTLNRLDDGTTYSPLIDSGRAITYEVATTAIGVAPVAGDYKLLFKGEIDENDFAKSPLVIDCRDQGGLLVDRWVESEAPYGSIPGVAVETVDQQVLDATLGASFVPVYTPASPSYLISPPYVQKLQSLMDASLALAQLPGFTTHYKWDDGTSSFRFTFYEPPRSKTVPDWTYTKGQYFEITSFKIDRKNIKNVIYLSYLDSATKTRLRIVVSDSTSITKYGRRPFFVTEGDTSPIDSSTKANTMAAAMLSDMKDPKAEAAFEIPFNWAMEIHDLIRFAANGIHHDTAQDLAVVSIRDEINRKKARMVVLVRGKPAGMYALWRDRSKATGRRPGERGPVAHIRIDAGSNKYAASVIYSGSDGTAPLTYVRRIDIEGVSNGTYSSPAALSGSVQEWIPAQQYHDTFVFIKVTDATGLVSPEEMLVISAYDDSAAGSGHGAGQAEEERVRGGGGGHGRPGARYNSEPQYDHTGSILILNPVTRELQAQAGVAPGFKTRADTAVRNVAGSLSFGINRHNDEQTAINNASKTFGLSFDSIPQMRALPQNWTLPGTSSTVDRKIEFLATGVSVSGYTARAVYSTGSSSSAQTENPATTLNGTPVSSVTLQNQSAVAYWNLANANNVLTRYFAHYDVDTTNMDASDILTVDLYRNDGVGSTNWSLVDSKQYSAGAVLSDQQMFFDAALDTNWDLRIVLSYLLGGLLATIVVKACTYDKITAGTEVSLTGLASNGVLFQAMEAP